MRLSAGITWLLCCLCYGAGSLRGLPALRPLRQRTHRVPPGLPWQAFMFYWRLNGHNPPKGLPSGPKMCSVFPFPSLCPKNEVILDSQLHVGDPPGIRHFVPFIYTTSASWPRLNATNWPLWTWCWKGSAFPRSPAGAGYAGQLQLGATASPAAPHAFVKLKWGKTHFSPYPQCWADTADSTTALPPHWHAGYNPSESHDSHTWKAEAQHRINNPLQCSWSLAASTPGSVTMRLW